MRIPDPELRFEPANPLCGDCIRVETRIAGNSMVEDIRVSGEMHVIGKASASILFASLERMMPAAIPDLSDEQVLGG